LSKKGFIGMMKVDSPLVKAVVTLEMPSPLG